MPNSSLHPGTRQGDVAPPLSPNKTTAPWSRANQVTGTLVDAWSDATKFFEQTARHQLTTRVTAEDLDTAISQLAAEHEVKPQKSLKRRRLDHLGRNIIDGILAVGGIAAEAATPAFPPAGLCFSALSFVLGASRRISGVFDIVLELFEEIEDFLIIFKILRRIDWAKRLDPDMVEKASKMLISLVQICALTTNMIEHRKWTSFKAAVLSNDSGAGEKLTDFQKSARKLDQLTNTVSLEHIVHIESVVVESKEHLDFIATSARDQKTEKVNASRLQKIDEKLWARKEREAFKALTRIPDYEEDLIPGTLDSLENQPGYLEWSKSSIRPVCKGLCLIGESGTGKSRLLHALREQLEERRQKSDNDRDSVYVAYHSFDTWSTGLSGSTGNSTSAKSQTLPTHSLTALRAMAYQIARQSTRYAMALEKALSDDKDRGLPISQETDISRLWERLQLSKFDAPEGATVYLLFDDVDWVKEHKKLFKLLSNLQLESTERNDTVNVRSFFTGSAELHGKLCEVIDTKVTTTTLLPKYVSSELSRHEIFQHNDKRSLVYRQKILDAAEGRNLPSDDQALRMWSFKVVQRQIQRIKSIYDRSAPASELTAILQMKPSLVQDQTAKESLDRLTKQLSSEQKAQINNAITWVLYNGQGQAWVEDIEALLILANCGDSLQSFSQQVGSHFSELFEMEGGQLVRLRPEYEEILRQDQASLAMPSRAEQPQINLNMSIKDADEAVVRNFVWQLNDGISSGKFDFASHAKQSYTPIYANKLEGNITIVKLCLKLLNEGWEEEEETVPLLYYARSWLPRHFVVLYQNLTHILRADQSAVTQALVDYLRDPYHLFRDQDRRFGDPEEWLESSEGGANVKLWLRATEGEASSSNRRWISLALHPDRGRSGYLRDVARAVGRKWISQSKADAKERYDEDSVRTFMSLEVDHFRWLDDYLADLEKQVDDGNDDNNSHSETADDEQSGDAGREATEHITNVTEAQDSAHKSSTTAETMLPSDAGLLSGENTFPTNDDGSSGNQEVPASIAEEPPAPAKDVIERAIQWLRVNEAVSESDGQFLINVGYTYLNQGAHWTSGETKSQHLEKAALHFSSARELDDFRAQALAGLGRTSYALGQMTDAVDHFSRAVDMLTNPQNQSPDETETTVLVELLRELALISEQLEQNDGAVRYCARSLEVCDDYNLRFKVLRLVCKTPSADPDLVLLSKWCRREDGTPSVLADAIYPMVILDPSCELLKTVVAATRNSSVNALLQEVLSEVVEIAKSRSETQTLPGVLSCLGIAQAKSLATDRQSGAVKSWREAFTYASREDDDSTYFHHTIYLACRGLAMEEFEYSRSQMAVAAARNANSEERVAIAKQLSDRVQKFRIDSDDYCASMWRQDAEHFITATYVLSGQTEQIRLRTLTQMNDASEILLDDDPDNDLEGISSLLRLFCTLGDEVGALTAFSLLDRRARDKLARPASPDTDGDKPEPGVELGIVASDHLYNHSCDSCDKLFNSLMPKGIWWCQFCNNIDFCDDCHREFAVDRSLNLHFCDPGHRFIHLYHTNYEPEEIAEGQVKIGWQRVDLEDGSFKRDGGEVIAVSTWMERLRVEWGLPARPEGVVKAQK